MEMGLSEAEIIAVNSSSGVSSSGGESSQRLASKSKRWSFADLHQSIIDALDNLRHYSYNNIYKVLKVVRLTLLLIKSFVRCGLSLLGWCLRSQNSRSRFLF